MMPCLIPANRVNYFDFSWANALLKPTFTGWASSIGIMELLGMLVSATAFRLKLRRLTIRKRAG